MRKILATLLLSLCWWTLSSADEKFAYTRFSDRQGHSSLSNSTLTDASSLSNGSPTCNRGPYRLCAELGIEPFREFKNNLDNNDVKKANLFEIEKGRYALGLRVGDYTFFIRRRVIGIRFKY